MIPAQPLDEELDFFGLTHQGKVRPTNQDHFLVCSLHKTMRVWGTSLPDSEVLEAPTERLAFLAMVADGVGSTIGGEVAARATLETAAAYVRHAMRCFYATATHHGEAFHETLRAAVRECHASVLARGDADPALKGLATTLTLGIGVWPTIYLVQVGDSRAYRLRGGVLERLTRDQTMAQELVDQGLLSESKAQVSPFAHVLASAVGGSTLDPVVTPFPSDPLAVVLLCTDGLTKHVSEERIRDRLATMRSARQVCTALRDDALDGGGTDNITVVVGRVVPSEVA